MRKFFAAIKMFAFVLWCLIIVPTQMIVMLFSKGNAAYVIPRLWHKGVCAIFGVSYEIVGEPSRGEQTLYMFNHLSYLDIPLIGGVLNQTSFLAKSEVANWPVFGFLSKLQQTAYIERRRTAIKDESDKIKERVDKRQNLIVFPEGTSTDGVEVRDFKSSLFTLAVGSKNPDLLVQPVTLSLVSTDGKVPETLEDRRNYTWPVEDEIELPEHLWRFAQCRGARVKLTFHETLKASAYSDRKTLAKACHDRVSKGLNI
ncbi:1-acyl-sn-glycerol-3-phosphate acyltransferase [Alphaproteobacteria bacterium]|nr:1-acyl-sn-glycerol-3-phosphate acyltransferase [Alphaproteobacteria bacterium]